MCHVFFFDFVSIIWKEHVSWTDDEDTIEEFGNDNDNTNDNSTKVSNTDTNNNNNNNNNTLSNAKVSFGRGKGGRGLGRGGARRFRRVCYQWYEQIPKNKIIKFTDVLFKIDTELRKVDYDEKAQLFRKVMKPFFEDIMRQTITVADHQRKKTVDGVCFHCYRHMLC